jgi:hypothetical protein
MPSWIGEKYGAKAERMWTHVRDSCRESGGSNCEAQATAAVQRKYGKSIRLRRILKMARRLKLRVQ